MEHVHKEYNAGRDITTDEILKMYENVEIDLSNYEPISTDEILKMCGIDTVEIEEVANKTCKVIKTTRKTKEKKV